MQPLERRLLLSATALDTREKGYSDAIVPADGGFESLAQANNMFASRTALTGSSLSVTGSNVDATKEAGEKNHGYATSSSPGSVGGASIWWTWTASSSGTVQIDTIGSAIDTMLGVYTGTSLSLLTSVAQNDDIDLNNGVYTSRVSFSAVAGRVYQIAVDGYGGEEGAITLNINLVVSGAPNAPSNLTATAVSAGQINLTWTDRSTAETGYKIERATSPTGIWTQIATVGANVTTYSNTGLSGGTTYYYRVRAYNASATSGASNEVGRTTYVAASNNNFASATLLTGALVTATGNNLYATKETGEPNHASNSGGASVWFRWMATGSAEVDIDTFGSNFDTLLGVYTGFSVGGLTSRASNDDSGSGNQSKVTFNAVANTVYYIAVDGYNGAMGNITLHINLKVPQPPAAPTLLSANAVSSNQINLSWSDSSTNETGFKIERKTGDTGIWTQIATVGANVTSYSNTGLAGGTTYHYRIRSYNTAGNSAYSSEVSRTTYTPPANNNFASATLLTGAVVTANGTNVYATKETGEPNHAGIIGGASVWWKWTASASAEVDIDTFGSNFDTILGVYTGFGVAGLTSRASNDDAAGGYQSKVTFNAVANTIYYIAVDGYSGATGSITLHINLKAPQPPVAPSGLNATAVSSSQINLTWSDNSTDETGFKIERKTGINGVWMQIATVGANVTSYSNTGLVANTSYYYRVRSYNTPGNSGYSNEASQTTFPTGPVNNSFANRTSLSGTAITATGSNLGANKETGEPSHNGNAGGKSVWWTWTAPTTGTVQIDTIGSTFDTLLGVYTGSSVTGLSTVASDDDSGGNNTSKVTFTAVQGTAYQIAVDGYNGAYGNITLHVAMSATPTVPAAPSNLNGTVISTSQINLSWTDNSGNETGFRIERKTGAAGTWAEIATVGANVTSYSSTGLMANTTYYYRVRAYNGTGNSAYSSEINRTTSASTGPANNNFAGRQQISGTSITTTGSNVNATKELGEPNHGGNTGGKSVWWTWTATQNGTVTIDTIGSSFDTLLGVYTGSSVGALTTIAGDDDSGGSNNSSRVTFSATSGTTYQIAVDGYNAASGNITLNLSQTAAPPSGGFSITLQLTGFTTGQQAIFQQAANRWAQIITGDLPNAVYNGVTVDDLLIAGSASAIDGVGNILGQAGWRERRTTGTLLPYYGEMKFDSADMASMEANGTLYGVILHEMGHVLGIGTMWTVKNLLTGAGGTNPRFTGTQATAAYNQIFGTSFTSVPVQGNDMPVGSRDSHWRESIFATELMTPQIGGSSNPISRITVGSLADIGYTVNFNAADAYTAPTGGAIVAGDSQAGSSGLPSVFNNDFAPLVLPLPTVASPGSSGSLATPPVDGGNLVNGALDPGRNQLESTPLGPTLLDGIQDLTELLSQPANQQTPARFMTLSQEFVDSLLAALSHNLPWFEGDQA